MMNPLRLVRAVVCALALAVIFPSQVFAQKVLLLAADENGAEGVQQRLRDTNLFTQVDLIRVDLPGSTVPLATLLQYDSVMTWSFATYTAPDDLGDALSQYVDQGHGVVQSAFAFFTGATLGGRWRALSYDAFAPVDGMDGMIDVSLVALQPGHAILEGVNGLSGLANFWHSGLSLVGGGQLVAEWSNHELLVATRVAGPAGGRVVGLDLYPVYASDADATRLMANALLFATTPAPVTNHPPTANAGGDVTVEATGPQGAAFTVTGVATDPDSDSLTLAWTGTGITGNQASFSDTLVPPVGVKSASTTLTFTVSDGHGGVASDTVVVTVTDTHGPVLANVPASVVTATATGASGAQVSYGPVTAVDLVDGPRPVTCSKSGLFPIGDTLVTCSSSDSRGNSSSASFTVRVADVTTPGMMWGDGTVKTGNVRYDVAFAVSERSFGQGALLELRVRDDRNSRRDDRFQGRSTNFVAFSNDPAVHPGSSRIDTVLFSGAGEWNGRSGYKYQMSIVDRGDAWHPSMRVKLTVTAPNGAVVANVDGTLVSGGCTLTRAFRR
jgi:HYR domain